jgi:fluoroacetyl-CoA thioesterase
MLAIPEGYEDSVGVVVTDEMTVEFGELGRVHPVYATYWLAKHMEEAGRKIILPFLEAGEEGVGSAVSVRHRAPALVGMRVEVVARHVATEGTKVLADCRAHNELGELIATGSTEQVVLPASAVEARFKELADRWRVRRSAISQRGPHDLRA